MKPEKGFSPPVHFEKEMNQPIGTISTQWVTPSNYDHDELFTIFIQHRYAERGKAITEWMLKHNPQLQELAHTHPKQTRHIIQGALSQFNTDDITWFIGSDDRTPEEGWDPTYRQRLNEVTDLVGFRLQWMPHPKTLDKIETIALQSREKYDYWRDLERASREDQQDATYQYQQTESIPNQIARLITEEPDVYRDF